MQIQARYLDRFIAADLKQKMVLVAGPLQVGKTTLAMQFLDPNGRYYNWDNRADRKAILAAEWPISPSVIVLDELHKYRFWKRWLKGEFDKHRRRHAFSRGRKRTARYLSQRGRLSSGPVPSLPAPSVYLRGARRSRTNTRAFQ